MDVYRQGDVWLYRLPLGRHSVLAPKNRIRRKPGQGVVLAEGETTGHAHRIKTNNVTLYKNPSNTVLKVSTETALLTHEEHETITLPKGLYEVRIQREYVPGPAKQRFVRD